MTLAELKAIAILVPILDRPEERSQSLWEIHCRNWQEVPILDRPEERSQLDAIALA